jgi:hypothetical protein
MGLPRLLRVSLVLLAASAPAAGAAEICSTSTLTSSAFSSARWCGQPPGAGTLRMNRRGGGAEDFLNVPIDTYREVIRTPNVVNYLAEEVQPHFRQVAAPARPVSATPIIRTARVPQPAEPQNAVPRSVTPVRPALALPHERVTGPQLRQQASLPRQAAANARPAAPARQPRKRPARARAQAADGCAATAASGGLAPPPGPLRLPPRKPACRS